MYSLLQALSISAACYTQTDPPQYWHTVFVYGDLRVHTESGTRIRLALWHSKEKVRVVQR